MKVFVDDDRCQGHLRCSLLVPEMFEADEMGHASTTSDEVPAGLEDRVRQAAFNCPEKAIRVED